MAAVDAIDNAAAPRPVSLAALWLLVRRTARESYEDRVLGLAAEAGFWALVALPPLLLAVVGTAGYVVEAVGFTSPAALQAKILTNASTLVSHAVVQQVLEPVVSQVLRRGRGDLVSIGFVISLWAGSTAMSAYVNTITIAYDMRDIRGAVRSRVLAFLLYLGAVVVGIVVLPLLVAGPQIGDALATVASRDQIATAFSIVYWPVAALVSVALVATLYHLSVPVRTPWRRDLPGAVLAMAVWLASSEALRMYFTLSLGKNPTYGTIAAPVAVLLWLYFTALAVLIGAELNAEIDKLWPLRGAKGAQIREKRRARSSGRVRDVDLAEAGDPDGERHADPDEEQHSEAS